MYFCILSMLWIGGIVRRLRYQIRAQHENQLPMRWVLPRFRRDLHPLLLPASSCFNPNPIFRLLRSLSIFNAPRGFSSRPSFKHHQVGWRGRGAAELDIGPILTSTVAQYLWRFDSGVIPGGRGGGWKRAETT